MANELLFLRFKNPKTLERIIESQGDEQLNN